MLRKFLDRIKPQFEKGGRFAFLHATFDAFETFLYVPDTVTVKGAHVRDGLDMKRTMIMVVLALVPCFLFGTYNVGLMHYNALGESMAFWPTFWFGCTKVLPMLIVSYVVGLGIEFIFAQYRGHEVNEGFLVSGFLIPLICPPDVPLWMLAVATAFAVIIGKEVFGGTGMNIWNPALLARAFLFFAYPAQMSGDKVFIATGTALGYGHAVPDGFTCATPLGQIATQTSEHLTLTGADGKILTTWDAFLGLIPGSFGETSMLCILIGAAILLLSRIADWRVMFSVFAGGLLMGWIANVCATPTSPASYLTPIDQLLYGGFAFPAVFMATDPVTAARTTVGKYIYGLLIGVIAVIIRTYNNGYPEGAMLAVLLMNCFAPLIDWCVVQANISRRMRRTNVISKNA